MSDPRAVIDRQTVNDWLPMGCRACKCLARKMAGTDPDGYFPPGHASYLTREPEICPSCGLDRERMHRYVNARYLRLLHEQRLVTVDKLTRAAVRDMLDDRPESP